MNTPARPVPRRPGSGKQGTGATETTRWHDYFIVDHKIEIFKAANDTRDLESTIREALKNDDRTTHHLQHVPIRESGTVDGDRDMIIVRYTTEHGEPDSLLECVRDLCGVIHAAVPNADVSHAYGDGMTVVRHHGQNRHHTGPSHGGPGA